VGNLDSPVIDLKYC